MPLVNPPSFLILRVPNDARLHAAAQRFCNDQLQSFTIEGFPLHELISEKWEKDILQMLREQTTVIILVNISSGQSQVDLFKELMKWCWKIAQKATMEFHVLEYKATVSDFSTEQIMIFPR